MLTRGDVVVKRISNKLKEEKYLELISDNGFYEPYKVTVGDIREIWYVRAKISPFLPSPANLQNNLQEEVKQLRNTIVKQSHLLANLGNKVEQILDRED